MLKDQSVSNGHLEGLLALGLKGEEREGKIGRKGKESEFTRPVFPVVASTLGKNALKM